jgi:Ca-activated chloride channel family protein
MKTMLLVLALATTPLEYKVEVQVVELQVTVVDHNGNFQTDIKPEDFLVYENGVQQEVLDLELHRQPFSIGIVLDTSSSMASQFMRAGRAAQDFVKALQPQDEYFVMTFDDQIKIRSEMQLASNAINLDFFSYRYGERTRMYEGLMKAMERLKNARYPHRALFLISDGANTKGDYRLKDVIKTAQQNKVLIYSLIVEKGGSDVFVLGTLSDQTGGTAFVLDKEFPRLDAAYKKIASDLAHRITLYYHSTSDYSKEGKPQIEIHTKNPDFRVRFQKAYYFNTTE